MADGGRPDSGPGLTLGILGGGQLGRMLCMAARSIGVRTVVVESALICPASSVCDELLVGSFKDEAVVAQVRGRRRGGAPQTVRFSPSDAACGTKCGPSYPAHVPLPVVTKALFVLLLAAPLVRRDAVRDEGQMCAHGKTLLPQRSGRLAQRVTA